MQLETVAIVNPKDPTSWVLINVQDFDPLVHTLWAEREQDPPVPEQDPPVSEHVPAGEGTKQKTARRN